MADTRHTEERRIVARDKAIQASMNYIRLCEEHIREAVETGNMVDFEVFTKSIRTHVAKLVDLVKERESEAIWAADALREEQRHNLEIRFKRRMIHCNCCGKTNFLMEHAPGLICCHRHLEEGGQI